MSVFRNSPQSRAKRSAVIAASFAAMVAAGMPWESRPTVHCLIVSSSIFIAVFLAVVLYQALYFARELRVASDALTAVYGPRRERRLLWSEVRWITIDGSVGMNVEFVTRGRNVVFYKLGVSSPDWYSLESQIHEIARENHIPLYTDLPFEDCVRE
jgi:hypothetical protein